jgi:Rieske Fe-S protein
VAAGDHANLSRRELLAGASAVTAAVALGGCGGDDKTPPDDDLLRLVPVAELDAKAYTPRRVEFAGGPVTIYLRKEGSSGESVVAISGRCTHQGCPVRYVEAAQRFICPCHGAVFDFNGMPEGGPAKRPLDRGDTVVRDGVTYLKRQP